MNEAFYQVEDECRADLTLVQPVPYRCITGRVLACNGTGIEDVCVKAISLSYQPLIHTITDGQGVFTLIVEQEAPFFLIFSKAGYVTLQHFQVTDFITVCLAAQSGVCLLSGKILGGKLAPVSVQLVNGTWNRRVFSKPDGSFFIAEVPSGTYTVILSGTACREKRLHITIPQGLPIYRLGGIPMESMDVMCTIHGIISDPEGNPVENAVVVLFQSATRQPVLHTRTNENGLYFFGGVKKGCYFVEAYS